jgi:hypothetical protein
MGFFEPCSTMPAWHAWLLAAAIGVVTLLGSTLNHQVERILFHYKQKICDFV